MTTSPTLLMLLDELHTLALNDLPAVFTGEVFDSTLELNHPTVRQIPA